APRVLARLRHLVRVVAGGPDRSGDGAARGAECGPEPLVERERPRLLRERVGQRARDVAHVEDHGAERLPLVAVDAGTVPARPRVGTAALLGLGDRAPHVARGVGERVGAALPVGVVAGTLLDRAGEVFQVTREVLAERTDASSRLVA